MTGSKYHTNIKQKTKKNPVKPELLSTVQLWRNVCMHIIYNMFSNYTYYTVPIIIFIKENCSKIDFFSDQACHNSKMHYFCTTTVQMSKKALNMVKT